LRTFSDCESSTYRSNTKLQRWILAHLGSLESDNPYTNTRGTISVYQISKLLYPEILLDIQPSTDDILCNMLQMQQKGFLKESKPPFDGHYNEDEDMRSFYLTAGGMIKFRKEIQPIAKMMIETEPKEIEKAIENTKGDSTIKRIFIERITSFKKIRRRVGR
jgi:hypothetical protein